jgi:hypothetical protein
MDFSFPNVRIKKTKNEQNSLSQTFCSRRIAILTTVNVLLVCEQNAEVLILVLRERKGML